MHVKDYFGIWRWKSFIPSLCRSLGLLAAYRVWLWAESKDLGFPVAPPLQTSQEEKNLIQYCNRWALEFTSFPAAIHPHTTSFFAVTTLDFRSPSNLFVLLKHYCDPTWKQQLLLLFANIFISSPAAMLSWWNRCLRGSLLFASHGDEPGGSARPEQPRDSLRAPSPAGFPNGAGRRCAKLLVSAKGLQARRRAHGPCSSVLPRTMGVRWVVKNHPGFQSPWRAAAFHCNYPSHHCAV